MKNTEKKPFSSEKRKRVLERARESSIDSFSHDELSDIAVRDPDLLQEIRETAAEKVISEAAPRNQENLRRLQAGVVWKSKTAKNPIDACNKIIGQMWESYEEMSLRLNEFVGNHEMVEILRARMPKSKKEAVVLDMTARQKKNANPDI